MIPLHFYRLRNVVDGREVSSFDDFVDMEEERQVERYPEVVLPDFRAVLYVATARPDAPPWVKYLRDHFKGLIVPDSGASGGLLIVRLEGTTPDYFAFAFGTIGRFLMRDDAWVRAYGLRTALNLMFPTDATDEQAPARLRGLQSKRRGGSTVRTLRQATRSTTLAAFEIDRLRDVVGGADGSPEDPDTWGTRIQGADAFQFRIPVEFKDLGKLCKTIEEVHGRTDYRQRFPMVDHIRSVGDPDVVERLEQYVVTALRAMRVDDFDLAPPEIIDWSYVDTFRYHFDGRRRQRRPDLALRRLPERGAKRRRTRRPRHVISQIQANRGVHR